MTQGQCISLNDSIVRKKGNIVSNMDKDKVMLSIHSGKYYNLGEIGGEIWDRIEMPVSVAQLVSELISEYDVNQSDCTEHVISFLQQLFDEGLILIEK